MQEQSSIDLLNHGWISRLHATKINPTHIKNLQYLKNTNTNAYTCLTATLQSNTYDRFPEFQFLNNLSSNSAQICNKFTNHSYVCRTCQYDSSYAICSYCFDFQFHRGHNFYVQAANGGCQCGLPLHPYRCCLHGINTNSKEGQYSQEPVKRWQQYQIFTYELMNIFLMSDTNFRIKYTCIFEEISKLISQYSVLIQDTIISFMSPCHFNKNMSILQGLLFNYRSESLLFDPIESILKILLTNKYFQIKLMQSIYKKRSIRSLDELKGLKRLVSKLLKNHQIIAELAKREILVYQNQPPSFLIPQIYWTNLHTSYFHRTQQTNKSMATIFKFIASKFGTNLAVNQPSDTQQILYLSIASDKTLLQQLLRALVEQQYHWEISTNSIDTEIFNIVMRAIFYSVEGRMEKVADYFINFDKSYLAKFVKHYFKNILLTRRKCKFNGLTVKCLLNVALRYGFQNSLITIPSEQFKISCLHFTKNITILLKSLFCFDHQIAFQQLKIAQEKKDLDRILMCKKIIIQWMQGYLWSRKQVLADTVKSWKYQNILMFKQAKQIFKNQTELIVKQKHYFSYTGPQMQITSAIYLSDLTNLSHLFNLRHNIDQSQFFCNKQAAIMLEKVLNIVMPLVQLKKYLSCNNKQKEWISSIGIILNHITNRKNQLVCQYVQQLKNINEKIRKPSDRIVQMFSLHRKPRREFMPEQSVLMQQQRSQPLSQQPISSVTSLQKIQQTIKPPDVTPKSLTNIDLESSRKRTQKMKRLKQKFLHKSSKYSISQSSIREQQEVCLICRQANAKPKQKSFLYYLASIKDDQASRFLLGMEKEEKNIVSCFHAFHQKCLGTSQLNVCTLCKVNGNFVLPVLSDGNIESQYFVAVWWNQFLNMTSFVPVTQNQGNNSYTNTQKPQQLQLQQQQKSRRFLNFPIIYRQILSRLTSLFTQSSSQLKSNQKKQQYFYKLMQILYNSLTEKDKKLLFAQIQEYEQYIIKSNLENYVKDLNVVASEAIKIRLKNSVEEDSHVVVAMMNDIVGKYAGCLVNCCLANVQKFLAIRICTDSKQGEKKVQKKSTIITNYIKIPQTMSQLYKLREKCKKCYRICDWQCLFCKFIGCNSCDNRTTHTKSKHANNTNLILQIDSGKLIQMKNGNAINQQVIYTDVFGVQFSMYIDVDLEEFTYSIVRFNKSVEKLFMNP